jgi:transposase
MDSLELARQVKAMTRQEVVTKAMGKKLSWRQAAMILGLTERQVRRIRRRMEKLGLKGLVDRRHLPRRKRISSAIVDELCRLRRELYRDFSVTHFYEFATEKHGLHLSYTKAKAVLQEAGLALKFKGRGKYRRRRERRPMRGMMLHLDGSTHGWIEGLPNHDLMVMLDDATSEIVYARFFEQEGTLATLDALKSVLAQQGRFCELYTDRGSHFCNTTFASKGPDSIQAGTVSRVLYALRIKHTWAFSPQARGRSERAFGTIQGRLPQELRLNKIRTYAAANRYLERTFIPDFNSRFSVTPAQPETAFARVDGVDLDLLVSIHHPRMVRNDNTVFFDNLILQLPPGSDRRHHARCDVTVHEFVNGDLGVSYKDRLLVRSAREGLRKRKPKSYTRSGPPERRFERTSLSAHAP